MAASSAGVFWRAGRQGELAYGHTRTHFLEGGRGGRLISPAGPREGGRGGGTTSLKGGYGPPGWQKNPTQSRDARRGVAHIYIARGQVANLLIPTTRRSAMKIFLALHPLLAATVANAGHLLVQPCDLYEGHQPTGGTTSIIEYHWETLTPVERSHNLARAKEHTERFSQDNHVKNALVVLRTKSNASCLPSLLRRVPGAVPGNT